MSEQSYIPINKGHYDLDTDGRKKQFEIKLSSGWKDDYAEYRNLWKKLPRIKKYVVIRYSWILSSHQSVTLIALCAIP